MNSPTVDQILALAPDASAAKAGRELASPRRWPRLGRDDDALWGEAQGSGAEPYRVVALGDGSASKCSCPSRKFPCKHVLGLLLLAAESPQLLARGVRPAHVDEWLRDRAAREAKRKEREERAPEDGVAAPVDVVAQEKRRAKRAQRIEDGLDLLDGWLRDLVRGGLAAEGLHAYEPWQSIERRLVDAQAPGLAARVAATGERVRRGAADAFAAMHDVGALYALVRAARRPDLLSEDAGRAVRQALGETVPSEDVLSTPAVADAWFVAARSVAERDRIVNVRTWILGAACRQWAYVLRSSPVHAPVADPTPLGATLYGELCRYPGPAPLRGIFRGTPALRSAAPPAPAAFDELLARHAAALVEEPWRQATPFFVRAHPGELHGSPALVDAAGAALPARLAPPALTLLHAVAGGRPAPVAGVFDGRCVEPLSVCDGGDWIDLGGAVA